MQHIIYPNFCPNTPQTTPGELTEGIENGSLIVGAGSLFTVRVSFHQLLPVNAVFRRTLSLPCLTSKLLEIECERASFRYVVR